MSLCTVSDKSLTAYATARKHLPHRLTVAYLPRKPHLALQPLQMFNPAVEFILPEWFSKTEFKVSYETHASSTALHCIYTWVAVNNGARSSRYRRFRTYLLSTRLRKKRRRKPRYRTNR